MIRYAATAGSGVRIVRARSVVAVSSGGGWWCSKSTQAAYREQHENDDAALSSAPQESSSLKKPRLPPPAFQSQHPPSWRDRLEQHQHQSKHSSSWRRRRNSNNNSTAENGKDWSLSEFFEKRRQSSPGRLPPPAFGRRWSDNNDKRSSNGSLDHNAGTSSRSPARQEWRNRNTRPPAFSQGPLRRPSKDATNKSFEKDDMTDVSDLKAAFMKSVSAHWNKDKTTTTRSNAALAKPRKTASPLESRSQQQQHVSLQKPAWRQGGAKAFRQLQQERKKEQRERSARYHRTKRAAKNFFNTSVPETNKQTRRQQGEQQEEDLRVLLPRDACSVGMLSSVLGESKKTVVRILEDLGEKHVKREGYEVDVDTMELVTLELGLEPVRDQRRRTARVEDDKNLLLQRRAAASEEQDENLEKDLYESFPPRPPVVACMGHVDHGKTTLTDALRRRSQASTSSLGGKKKKKKSKKNANSQGHSGDIAGTEAGGITQVISAFQIALEQDQQERGAVTFLDTPGHAAFKSMRESGSHAADVIVLVVAADDGVSPQTVEILDFYKSIVKEAGSGAISLVVAMTKIDKPGIDVEESKLKIESQLLEQGIVTEEMASLSDEENEYGPPVQLIPVSGLTGEGVDDLIEGLVLQSEVMDLRADQQATAEGIVMDARVEKGLGVVADCIVRWGSLERGNVVVSGVHFGKVKVLKDVYGKTLKNGLPSQPVRIIGFETLPKAGDPVICVSSEEKAKRLVEKRQEMLDVDPNATAFRCFETVDDPQFQVTGTASKNSIMTEMAENRYAIDSANDANGAIRIPVLIKADADGTLAAVRDSLLEVGSMSSAYDIVVDPVGLGIGPILTSDVALAQQSGAAIFCFGLQKLNDKSTVQMAEGDGVVIRNHDVIYSLLDDAKDVFAQHLPPTSVEVVHGSAEVQAIFNINNKHNAEVIAGLKVLDGNLYKDKVASASEGGGKNKTSFLDCHYRVLRNGEPISAPGETVRASSLKRVKEDVDSVRRGDECGLGLDGFGDFEEGDVIECYSIEMRRVFA